MATVIVPAHNEANLIEACLDSIIDQAGVDQIIVACNGCTDETVSIVKNRYPGLICLDIEMPSKTNALNEAEAVARQQGMAYPIFYIDADTRLSANAIQHISNAMQQRGILLAAPTPFIDTSRSSWPVKRYYQIWTRLPYIKEGVIATCSFILSEEGRARFERFADVINDDGYVRCHFYNHEIANIEGATIQITAPRTLFSLIKIKTRARLGNMQLLATGQCPVREAKHYGNVMRSRLLSREWLAASVYVLIALVIRIRARWQYRKLATYVWETDTSSR